MAWSVTPQRSAAWNWWRLHGSIGRNTVTAIQSGLLYGHAGMIDRAIEMISAEIDARPSVVATGGLAPVVAPLCRAEIIVDDSLTLEGLRIIYRLQTSP